MSSIPLLIVNLKQLGISLQLVEENLKINGPKVKLTPALLEELKENKTEIIQFLKKAQNQVKYSDIQAAEKKEYYDVSFAQRRLWVLCQFEADSVAYNMPMAWEIYIKFDLDIFERALQALVQRHESLRTVFMTVNGELKQRILENPKVNLERIDLRYSNEDEKEKKAKEIFIAAAHHVFDLKRTPPIIFKAVITEEQKYLLMGNIHHIVNDGWSMDILRNEIMSLYNAALAKDENLLPALKLQYRDYTRWHNLLITKGRFNPLEDYWLDKFKDKPNGIQLPADHPRHAIQTFNGGRVGAVIDAGKTRKLQELGREEDATLFMLLLSLLSTFLYRITGEKDIIVGAPVAGRRHKDLHGMVGFLVNTLVYRVPVNPGDTFLTLLGKVKKEAVATYENQDYPFDLLVERLDLDRDLSQSPLFNVMIAHNNADMKDEALPAMPAPAAKEGGRITSYSTANSINMSKFDLIFFMDKKSDVITIVLEYNSDLFEKGSVRRMVNNFLHLVDSVLIDAVKPVNRLQFLDKTEYETVVQRFNESRYCYPMDTIPALLEVQVEKSPHQTAVVNNDQHISYEELNQRANRLAHFLRDESRGRPNDIIGVLVDRSEAMIIAILGIIKSGAGYVSIDPNYPRERIMHILSDSGTQRIILDRDYPEMLGDYRGERINIHGDWPRISLSSGENPEAVNQGGDIVYVIYTSGSTGMPHGAMLSQAALSNLVQWQQEKSTIDSTLRCLQFTSINFCVSFQEIMVTLCSGGQVHLIGDIERQDIDYLLGFLSKHRIEILYLPFSYLNFLFNETSRSSRWGETYKHSLKHIITAGEQLKITAGLKVFLERNPGLRLHNHYGSSEMHVVTSYTLDGATAGQMSLPPAGRPISNTRIYILDRDDNVAPLGVWGELCVAGCVEIAGYINNRTLTEQKLLKHPVLCRDHIRLYRSGDIGRWREDGNIELKGRKDFQVKIHGFRVEPGEIESKITMIPQVKDCVVIVREWNQEKFLVAYVVLDNIKPREVSRIIRGYLPQHMIPLIIPLEALPLMPNGKVDREKLPAPAVGPGENYIAPRNEVEEKMAAIWAEVLKIETGRISVNANFFDLGGHSLKATVMATQIHKEFNVVIPLAEIFKAPTIEELAYLVTAREWAAQQSQKHVKYQEIAAVEKKEYYALSSAQKRLYILQKMELIGTAYNMPSVFPLDKSIDQGTLREILKQLIARHESLRTSFIMIGNETVQVIHDEVEYNLEYFDLSGSDETLEAAGSSIRESFIRSFDLSRASLFRVGLIRRTQGVHLLIIDTHHIISDGISQNVLIRDFVSIASGKPLPTLRLQYKDFSAWQNSRKETAALKQQEDYWLKHYADEIPVLELPQDYTRPLIQDFEGNRVSFILNERSTRTLYAVGRDTGATLYMSFLAVFSLLLSKLSGQEDIVVGIPIAGRSHADLKEIVGMFVNTLALRIFPAAGKVFRDYLQEVKNQTLEAYENQDYQFEDLVDRLSIPRDVSRNPLYDVVLNLPDQSENRRESQARGDEDHREHNKGTAKFDMNWLVLEAGDKLLVDIEYSTKLFKPSTIDRYIQYFKQVLAVLEDNAGITLSDVEIIAAEEKHRLLYEFNDTARPYPVEKTIHRLYEEQVEKNSWQVAVVYDEQQLTYDELDREANCLAGRLKMMGINTDQVVGIAVHRSLAMIEGVLGILKAGGAYLPIEPGYPRKRIDYMLADSGARVLITAGTPIESGKLAERLREEILPGKPVLVGTDTATSGNPVKSSLAYVIYTSGTTGRPKGVMVDHRNVIRLVKNSDILPFHEKDRILQSGALEFDASTFEIWGALLNGITLYLSARDTILNPLGLGKMISDYQITVMWLTSPLFNQLVQSDVELFSGIRYLLVGGDVLHPSHIDRVRLRYPALKVINGYGPTENTTFSTTFLIDKEYKGRIPIGKPIANSTAYIVGKSGKLQPVGIGGELWVGGDGVSRGYLNNPGMTKEKFGGIPFRRRPEPIYKTGDLALWLEDGNIEFLGRIDRQVKISGYRVESAEIEKQLLINPRVKEVVVMVREEDRGDKYLCAYIVPEGELTAVGLREYLSGILPGYMIPTHFVFLEKFPLTPNAKIDNRELPAPDIKGMGKYISPRTPLEEKLQEIWSELLGIEKDAFGITDNFFDLGGHSLKATVMAARIHKEFNTAIPLAEIFRTPTIEELANLVTVQEYSQYSHQQLGRHQESLGMEEESLGSSIPLLIVRLKQLQITMQLEEGDLKLNGPQEKVPPVLLEEIREQEAGIIFFLRQLQKQGEYKDIEVVEKKEYYALSSAQKRLYILQQMELSGTGYNMPYFFPLNTAIEREILQHNLNQLISRHESLRTSFIMLGKEPVQRIHDELAVNVELFDLRESGTTTAKARSIIRNSFIRAFDLSQAPLIRVGIIKTSAGNDFLMVDTHHIVTDGSSQDILSRDIKAFAAREKLVPLRLQYKDFSQWQKHRRQTAIIKQQEAYWLDLYSDEIPVLRLPTDYTRPIIQDFEGNTVRFLLNERYTQTLREMARGAGATLYMAILSVYTLLLSKLSGQEDIIVGTPLAGRGHADLKEIVGMFANTLAIRTYPAPGKVFEDYLSEVKTCTLEAYDHQDYPFEDLVDKLSLRRDAARNPIFDVMLNVVNQSEYNGDTLRQPDEETFHHQESSSKFDMSWTVVPLGKVLLVSLAYCAKLFRPSTIENFIRYFKQMLQSLPAKTGKKISEIEIITSEEKQQILFAFNETGSELPVEETVYQLFAQQVQRGPHRIALVGRCIGARAQPLDEEILEPYGMRYSVTYRELAINAHQLAEIIREEGGRADTMVGLMVGRGIEMIIGILGILKSGGAYLPIDPESPPDRVDYMLKDSGAKILVTTPAVSGKFQKLLSVNDQLLIVNTPHGSGSDAALLTETCGIGSTGGSMRSIHGGDSNPHGSGSDTALLTENCGIGSTGGSMRSIHGGGSNLVYIIYTSGSTGKPKGVLVDNKNLVNYIHWFRNAIHLDEADKSVLTSSYAFDLGYTSIFPPLAAGGEVHVIPRDIYLSGEDFLNYITRNHITYVKITPSLFKIFVESVDIPSAKIELGKVLQAMRLVVLGGEAIDLADVEQFRDLCPHIKVMNHYGPTEVTIGCIAKMIDFGSFAEYKAAPTIGNPIGNTRVYIQDKSMHLLPVGIAGELVLAGEGVARGYLNNPELTSQKFLWKSFAGSRGGFSKEPLAVGDRVYKTGDWARWQAKGEIEFLGRVDNQVKIMGFRVELGEIENLLRRIRGIKEVVVIAVGEKIKERYLCAYIVGGGELDHSQLRTELARDLPDYMIPSFFISLGKIPMTANGKIDRRALPEPVTQTSESSNPPRSLVEQKLAAIWGEVLGRSPAHATQIRDTIGIHDSFFEMGGNSLSATIMVARVHKVLNARIPLAEVFKTPTIKGIATYIAAAVTSEFAPVRPVEKKDYYFLSSAQQRLYVLYLMEPLNTVYNVPRIIPIGRKTDKAELEGVFRKIVGRHESFRTSFRMKDDEPVQRIVDELEIELEYYDLRQEETIGAGNMGIRPGVGEEGRLFSAAVKQFIRPFDLAVPPLVRIGLLHLENESGMFILVVDMHHIISDGVSHDILRKDFMALLSGQMLSPLHIQYKDFAQWQNSDSEKENLIRQEEYWLNEFSGGIPSLNLPLDYPRAEVINFEGDLLSFKLNRTLSEKTRALAAETQTTLMMLLLSVYTLMLAMYTGHEDILVGTVSAGRGHADLENIIGFFVNMLALRTRPTKQKSFSEYLSEVKEKAIAAFDNQDFPFDELVSKLKIERQPGRHPLIDTVFVFQEVQGRAGNENQSWDDRDEGNEMDEGKDSRYSLFNRAHFDMMLHTKATPESIYVWIEYSTSLFKTSTIKGLAAFYVEILEQVVENKDIKLKDIKATHDFVAVTSDVLESNDLDFDF